MRSRHTKESLQIVADKAVSFLGMARILGLKQHGGNASYLKKRCTKFGVNTSHFKGQAWARGIASNKRLSARKILVLEKKRKGRRPHHQLRRALLEIGREETCGYCGQRPFWNGKSLVLQIDHKNGNEMDNRPKNLEFACPNCHSQTDTFCYRNNGR